MESDDQLCFVQFLHPGGQHQPDAAGLKSWNSGDHMRKFLIIQGKATRGEALIESELSFWGEWEAESEVVYRPLGVRHPAPEHVWRPYYRVPSTYAGLQNTDPFVFTTFLYGICKQNRKKGPTQLRHLARGSVILFGSRVGHEFALDTVFVVKSWIDHNRSTYRQALTGHVPEAYIDVVIRPLYESQRNGVDACAPGTDQSWRLYVGATYDDPLDRMYSFFPCLPWSTEKKCFDRPIIRNERILTSNSPQGFRLNRQGAVADNLNLWQSVVECVVQEGLWLGIYAAMPEKRP